MKELNKNEIYSLEGLSDEQLKVLAERTGLYLDILKKGKCILSYKGEWFMIKDIRMQTAKAIDLFEEEKENNANTWKTFRSKEEFGNFIKELLAPAEERIKAVGEVDEYLKSKPSQYKLGIDTFKRCESNMSKEEILACCKFNIDKYNWRKKGQDKEDFEKIINYAKWALEQLK